MAKSRKQIAFDLLADKESPIYKYYNNLSSAYYHIEKSLNDNNFECHRQGSVYVSKNELSNDEVSASIIKVCRELPWLSECVSKFDITNIGKTHSLIEEIEKYCSLYEDKRVKMEISNDMEMEISF